MVSPIVNSISRFTYRTFFKRESVYFTTVVATGFGFSIWFNNSFEKWWDCANKGKQWKDIKDKYVSSESSEAEYRTYVGQDL